jgi:HAMP domain-containing protein
MKIKTKLSLFFTGFAILALILILIVSFYLTDTEIVKNAKDKLSAIAQIQKNRVEELINSDLEQLNQIQNRTGVIDALESYFKNPNQSDLTSLTVRLQDAQKSIKNFNTVNIYDLNSKLVSASNPDVKVEDLYDLNGLKEEIGENKIEINFKGDRKLVLHGPIAKDGVTLGTLLIIANIDDFKKITNDYAGLGNTGETTIAGRNDNGDAFYLDAPRFGSNESTVPKENTQVAITQALKKNEELFTNLVDYRNQPVYAVTKYIPEVDWGLVVKEDKAELFKPIYVGAWTLGGAGLLVIILTYLASIVVANSISRPIVKLQKGTEEFEKGNLDYKVGTKGKDEIGQLSRSFDNMSASLKESRKNTEDKIAERTKELEQINKAMVGRELKMIELKKEIEKLKKEK